MDKLLTEKNLLKGLALAVKINIISFLVAVTISVGWTYLLAEFWDWEYLMYLCTFYSINISIALLIRKWYENYLQRKEKLAYPKP